MQTAEQEALGQELNDLASSMEDTRRLIEPEYLDIEKFVTPWLSPFQGDDARPPERLPIYDTTAIKANRRMGNGLMGFTMSPSIRWFLLGIFGRYGEPLNASDIPGAAHWLRLVEDCLFGIFARSNFYPQGAEMTSLCGAYGSPTMWANKPRFNGEAWSFMCQHPKSIWISENERKVVDTFRRKIRMQNKDLARRWRKTLGEESTLVKGWLDAPAAWTVIQHFVYPNDEFDPGKLDRKSKKVRSVYSTLDGEILEDGGMERSQYLNWRWQVTSDQVYSGSVSMDAMAGIKMLQQMQRTLAETAQMAAEPPVQAPESMRNKVRLVPKGITYYDKPEQRIFPLGVAGNYPITLDHYKNEKQSVEDFYYADLWLMLERSPTRMTAYEVSQRIGEKASVLGPVVANNQSEFADPLISMVFNTEMAAGRLPPPPASLRSYAGPDGKGVKIIPHYIGPLAMAQKRNGIMDGFMTAINAITPIAQIRQEVLDHLDFDKWVRIATVSSGAPEEVINGMDQVMQIRKGRMQAQQQAQQESMQMELAKNFKGLATSPGAGSPGMAIAKSLGINQPEQAVNG